MRRYAWSLLAALVIALALAVPALELASDDCLPPNTAVACESWGMLDFQWWYFECWKPPCPIEAITKGKTHVSDARVAFAPADLRRAARRRRG